MRRAIDVLVTSTDSLRSRVAAAEKHFEELDADAELQGAGEWNLYHRIASTLVSGGDVDDDYEEPADYDQAAAVAESIAALDEAHLILIARDMIRLYELVCNPPDLTSRWPPDWPIA